MVHRDMPLGNVEFFGIDDNRRGDSHSGRNANAFLGLHSLLIREP
jgi:hypothetical protein